METNKNYIKKLFFIFFMILFIFILLLIRILLIANNYFYKNKAYAQQFYEIKIINSRANFYDSNLNKLTNEKKILKALVIPSKCDINNLSTLGCNIPTNKLSVLFKKNKPFTTTINKYDSSVKGVIFYYDILRYSNSAATPQHILGYVNKDNVGVCGLEKSLNEFLKYKSFVSSISFFINGKNKILNFDDFVLNSYGNPNDGIVLTINKNIQYILNSILQNYVLKGAGVVVNAKTGEILAISSLPSFNPNNISAEINNPNLPLFNRATQNFPLGSIFKIVTAASALKCGVSSNFSYCCSGCFNLSGTKFKCHNLKGHSNLNMPLALKASCNPYFINLGLKVGKSNILKTAKNFGFENKIKLSNGVYCKPSTLPKNNMKQGELCNFSFGQGKLNTSILHVAQMLSAVSCEGLASTPQIIKGHFVDNKFVETFKPLKFKALDEAVANKLKDMLRFSINNTKASSCFVSSGGKSSTAQTGQFKNKKEILNTWYCSFSNSSKNNNSFIVVLLKEDGQLGALDLGPAISLINSYLSLM